MVSCYVPNVPLPWGAGLWERGWPATVCFNTAESRGRTLLALCFWMCLALGRKFCWEMLAKGTRNLCRRHGEGWRGRRDGDGGGMAREEGCRERFSGVAMQTGAAVQARAETLCLPLGPNLHHQAGKPAPFLSSCLVRGLQKAYMKRQGVVTFFLNRCMHARNRL